MSSLVQPYYIEPRKGENHLSLDGEWSFGYFDEATDRPEQTSLPYRCPMPNSTYRALFAAGVLPDPYVATNSWLYSFTDEKVWYYRKTFAVPSSAAGKQAFLCFDGVSYYARVWLNGVLLGEHEGMYGGPVSEVRRLLKYGDENELTVEVKSCNFGKKASYDAWNLRGENREIVAWNIARDTFTTNGDFITFGIWNRVRLELVSPVHISRPFLSTERVDETGADLFLEFELADGVQTELHPYNGYAGNDAYNRAFDFGLTGKETERTVHFEVTVTDRETGKPVLCEEFDEPLIDYPGQKTDPAYQELQFVSRRLRLPNPKLWYPSGMGAQPLYDVTLTASMDGQTVDEHTFTTAIRTFEMTRTPGRKYRSRWNDFACSVNGKPFFLKGINWMPVDYLYAQDPKEYAWCIRMAKNLGIQMLRVWGGGGFPESDLFYQMCDEAGILVWQDFLLNNMHNTAAYPQPVLESQIAYNIYRIRNHPSLVLYCGGNEINPYAEGNAASMFVTERVIRDLDPTRVYHRTTADCGSAHVYRDMEPTWFRRLYGDLPFMAECGIHSFPSLASLKKLVKKEEWTGKIDLLAPDAKQKYPELLHHFTEFKPDRIPRMTSRASRILDVGNADLPDLCESTHVQAYEFYTLMIGAMRENAPRCAGVMPWVFKRHWTTVGIQTVDGMGQPTYPYYAVKKAFLPLNCILLTEYMVLMPGETIPLRLRLFNEDGTDLAGLQAFVTVYRPDMTVALHREAAPADLVDLGAFSVGKDLADTCFVVQTGLTDGSRIVADNVYWYTCMAEWRAPFDHEAYLNEPQENIIFDKGPWLKPTVAAANRTTLAVSYQNETLTVKNSGDTAAFPVSFATERKRFFASDNFVILQPQEERTFTLRFDDPTPDTLTVSAWNADPVTVTV